MGNQKNKDADKNRSEKIYLNIDHLKNGTYELQILLNKQVIKSVKIIK